ncbi:hypothetical protein MN116_002994 [Schistosoma mekongi]|uniref:Mitochondrial thiamine pyrophosphate carrier n=1 Tax=Schistosoma mekongi TaxID=38744 RepID=A0AAE1ZGY3_SCHME|nr:hypothetical protein MN116_002994 [Schistosoma mekongi]
MVQGQDRKTGLSTNEYLLAGSVSGFVARAVVQPLDVIKIRFQLQMEPIEVSGTSKYQGLIQAVRCISKEEGTIAFWKGHVPAQMQSVAFTSVQFLSFEVILSWLRETNSLLISDNKILGLPITYKPVGNFLCGCGAGFIAAVVTQPLDVLRTRFIAQGEPKTYGSMSHAAVCIITREGARGFFRGIVPSLLLIAPQTGIQFAIYHSVNQMINQGKDYLDPKPIDKSSQFHSSNRPIGPIQSLISGGLAGIGSKCVIYPLDMVKKRMQVRGFEEARVQFGKIPNRNGGLCRCLIEIWQMEGAAAFFKGLRPTLLKSFVSISCRFTVYEQICRFLHYQNHS